MKNEKGPQRLWKRLWRRWLPAAGMVLLAGFGVLWALFGHYYGKMQTESVSAAEAPKIAQASAAEEALLAAPPESEQQRGERLLRERLQDEAVELAEDDEQVQHILLIGCDGGALEGVRSDSMMVLSIHRREQRLVLCSLMRDMYVPIPNQWIDRLNVAYAVGGAELLLETVRENFGIPVENYVAVDFEGFMKLMELLGGVTVELESGESEAINRHLSEPGEALESAEGETRLSPVQALAYARMRSIGASDFDRTARQRKLLTALADELKGARLSELSELAMAVLPYVRTDLRQGQVFGLLLRGGEYLDYELETLRLPVDGSYRSIMTDGKSVLSVDLEQNRLAWRAAVYGEGEEQQS